MSKASQDVADFFAGNRISVKFACVDQDNADVPINLATSFATLQWALTSIDPSSGLFSTTPIVEKKSDVLQSETGGNEIDLESGDGTDDVAVVQLIGVDTDALAGDFYQELEGVDTFGESVVLATGTITIARNVENTP